MALESILLDEMRFDDDNHYHDKGGIFCVCMCVGIFVLCYRGMFLFSILFLFFFVLACVCVFDLKFVE